MWFVRKIWIFQNVNAICLGALSGKFVFFKMTMLFVRELCQENLDVSKCQCYLLGSGSRAEAAAAFSANSCKVSFILGWKLVYDTKIRHNICYKDITIYDMRIHLII